ncbi:poly-gamma-glutamate synthase PgsB/CapB [Rhodothalassium salexigens DSM 2132]|uniref:Poly-gamma-glutamate synthase PgsB/CapB n=1 Tax=Rhodothalassium salexigens DSM 2132 TaxID=1188247 RepID=A0A4R2PRL0_RHOSA|nr:poly-gamma-glutamate synthase PgsB [Rhodothalassium salexigens]MBB4210369.1 poly-gamma-glutamate synthase PgsB/CapB [Rhodothalassium salexigens DSM 2132]MBK1638571.1 poly-gamma-glutamate synthase PgsB [Rhodothalassium salexigens DSM 2132]TCP38533.1 poly-gamma-glutamate synthase PgsB/CapB [Rhodothalassium salexigens DSM 2132]
MVSTQILVGTIGGAWAFLVVFLVLEASYHRRTLKQIPIRIHVNGTRGKTSVVRLINAGLRAGGYRVVAKTTGSFAAFTGPDGIDYPIHRPDHPNIIEQMRVIWRMRRFDPEIAVIECMALQPTYQSLTERMMVKSTHGVITNARADHLDVMGPGPRDVALALAGSTPFGARLYTAERRYLDVFEDACADRGSELCAVGETEVAAIDDAMLAPFDYAEHAENVALALKVCEDLGVDRAAALAGMQALPPEVGATRILDVPFFGRSLVFVNAFAANDPESTEMIWKKVVASHGAGRDKIAVVNCRFDRPQRSQQLADVAAQWTPAEHYILIGSGTMHFANRAVKRGLSPNAMTIAEGLASSEIFETIVEHCRGDGLIVGMCNVHGGGVELARYFANRAAKVEEL